MRHTFAHADSAILTACKDAVEAGEVYDAAANAEAGGEGVERLDLYDRERQAFRVVIATPSTTPAGLAAKASLLARWQEHLESAALAFSIAKDAIAIGEAISAFR